MNKNKLEKDEIVQNLCNRIEELANTIIILRENDKIKNEQINNIMKRLQILEEKEKERKEKEREKKALKDIKESSICTNDEISFFINEFKKRDKFLFQKLVLNYYLKDQEMDK